MSKVCLSKLGFSRVVNYVVRSGFVPKYSIYHLLIRPPPKGSFCQLLVAVLFFLTQVLLQSYVVSAPYL